jgi:hypothetical protein
MHTKFWSKPEEKRPFERHSHRWEDNTNMDLREIGCDDVDSIHLAPDMD